MRNLAFVPVRGGSKSIENKNIKLLGGKPLVAWVLEELEVAKRIDKIVVATDDSKIVDVVNGLGLSKASIFLRSSENASDIASTESVMMEYIGKENLGGNINFLLVQATSPFTASSDFDAAISLLETGGFDSIISCATIKRFFWQENGKPINYDYSSRPRRQDFDGSLIENGAIYINSVRNILKDQNRLSGKIGIYQMEEHTSLELDEPEDWTFAEVLIRKHRLPQGKKNIKLLLSDVDGVLTDAGMYYSEHGDELKKFNTYDGLAFRLAKEAGIKVGIITSENTKLNKKRSEKMGLDFTFQGAKDKLRIATELCEKLEINLSQVAYIGDDINDKELLSNVGFAACPKNARSQIKSIPGITHLSTRGGSGALREFVELILAK